MKTPRTLIILVSAHEVKLFRQGGARQAFEARGHFEFEHMHGVNFAFSDRPPRDGGGHHGTALHAIDPRQTEREKERGRTVQVAIDALSKAWDLGDCDRIVLAAPEKMLGLLRAAMPRNLAQNVSAELGKDLLKTPLAELPARLGSAIRI